MWQTYIKRLAAAAGVSLLGSAGEADMVGLAGTLGAGTGVSGGAAETVGGTVGMITDNSPAPYTDALSGSSTITGTASTY